MPSSSMRCSQLTHMSCGSFESTGKRIASLCDGDGRGGKVVRLLQIVLWRGQSVFWHSGEQYEAEWQDEQSLVPELLQIMQD